MTSSMGFQWFVFGLVFLLLILWNRWISRLDQAWKVRWEERHRAPLVTYYAWLKKWLRAVKILLGIVGILLGLVIVIQWEDFHFVLQGEHLSLPSHARSLLLVYFKATVTLFVVLIQVVLVYALLKKMIRRAQKLLA